MRKDKDVGSPVGFKYSQISYYFNYFYTMNLSANNRVLLQQFFTGKPIKKAYLFGSYARNEADKNSDIDVLVELDHSKPIGMLFFSYQQELEKLLNMKVDLVSNEGLSKYIKPIIDKEKILIYERGNH